MNTETLVCPEGRLELWITVQLWHYFSVERIGNFKGLTGYMISFFLVIIIKY